MGLHRSNKWRHEHEKLVAREPGRIPRGRRRKVGDELERKWSGGLQLAAALLEESQLSSPVNYVTVRRELKARLKRPETARILRRLQQICDLGVSPDLVMVACVKALQIPVAVQKISEHIGYKLASYYRQKNPKLFWQVVRELEGMIRNSVDVDAAASVHDMLRVGFWIPPGAEFEQCLKAAANPMDAMRRLKEAGCTMGAIKVQAPVPRRQSQRPSQRNQKSLLPGTAYDDKSRVVAVYDVDFTAEIDAKADKVLRLLRLSEKELKAVHTAWLRRRPVRPEISGNAVTPEFLKWVADHAKWKDEGEPIRRARAKRRDEWLAEQLAERAEMGCKWTKIDDGWIWEATPLS